MADSSDQVLSFLRDLAKRSKPFAAQDLNSSRPTPPNKGCADLQSWDSGFFGEKLREQRYSVPGSPARLLPDRQGAGGLFAIVQRLYGIEIAEQKGFDTWHPDAPVEIKGKRPARRRFFFDLYARANKRGGAWMDGARDRRRTFDGVLQSPVANLVCNFTPADSGKPALLTHDEVTTLFHEFGHGLHHLLTRVEHAGVSGINGVAWDAVELLSQFMENWCWEPEGLALIPATTKPASRRPRTCWKRCSRRRTSSPA